MRSRVSVSCLALLVFLSAAAADVRLPNIISDHMVLQSGTPVRIFGSADPAESVTVRFAGQTATAMTNPQGKWHVWLQPMAPSTAGEMTIAGRNTITVSDVLVGEVWVGSGQSNMQWSVNASANPDEEARNANYPKIRLFRVPLKTMDEPQNDVDARWVVCTPENVRAFSAVLYFFGRDLHKHLDLPFGLIQTAYGGTPAQAWTSREALHADPALLPVLSDWNRALNVYPEASAKFHDQMKEWDATSKSARAHGGDAPRRPATPLGPGHAHTPSGLYNAMIHPLIDYTIKGATWYQGETNANRTQAKIYKRLFQTMIQDWRRAWGIGDFPFLFVQLANFAKAGSPEDWVLVQEAQEQTLELRHTGMAVINDIGDPGDIHPKNKQDVGARLARAARHLAYHEREFVFAGPSFRMVTSETAATGDRGVKLRVWFDRAGKGLKTRDGGPIRGFEVAGPDKVFHSAEARIEGKNVLVWSPTVADPVMVRYAWASNPDCNLVNSEGLPAGVFRSHTW